MFFTAKRLMNNTHKNINGLLLGAQLVLQLLHELHHRELLLHIPFFHLPLQENTFFFNLLKGFPTQNLLSQSNMKSI